MKLYKCSKHLFWWHRFIYYKYYYRLASKLDDIMTCKGIINKTIWGYSLLRTGIPFAKQPKKNKQEKK